jgi:hypothetical protein
MTEKANPTECYHQNIVPLVANFDAGAISTKCADCGRIFQRSFDNRGRFNQLVIHTNQGLIPADFAATGDWLTDDQKLVVAQITPCPHDRKETYKCCSGAMKERCLSCGRVWTKDQV